jgi:hypothetical protein
MMEKNKENLSNNFVSAEKLIEVMKNRNTLIYLKSTVKENRLGNIPNLAVRDIDTKDKKVVSVHIGEFDVFYPYEFSFDEFNYLSRLNGWVILNGGTN